MNLLALTRYGDLGASSRMRTVQYIPALQASGINVEIKPLLTNEQLSRRYASGNYNKVALIRSYFARIAKLISKSKPDLIWIEKELVRWLPGWFETLLLRKHKFVLDYDDAVFHMYDLHRIRIVRKLYGRKIDYLMKHSAMTLAGNEYLADRARKAGCRRVEVVPTVIDLERYPREQTAHEGDEFVVGWIGSPSTTVCLAALEEPIVELSKETKLRLRVIGAAPISFPGVTIEQLDWKESEEAAMLAGIDMGIMPLRDSKFERGKCGYKLIQYMACSKPVAASPVGVNSQIVNPDNGFLCDTTKQWLEAFREIYQSRELGLKMGLAGRLKVEEQYCIQKTGPRVASLLMDLVS